jgi:hypothetical protein
LTIDDAKRVASNQDNRTKAGFLGSSENRVERGPIASTKGPLDQSPLQAEPNVLGAGTSRMRQERIKPSWVDSAPVEHALTHVDAKRRERTQRRDGRRSDWPGGRRHLATTNGEKSDRKDRRQP